MSWEAAGAIGEIAGAIGVVATLFYFSRQIKATLTNQTGDSVSRAQEVELKVLALELQYSGLIVRANEDLELDTEQQYQVLKIYRCRWSAHLLEFIRTKALGRNHNVAARNMARALQENPCYKRIYDQAHDSPDRNVQDFR